jgi:hypothetical protein
MTTLQIPPARPVELYRRGGRGGVYVYDPAAIAWRGAGKDGVLQKVVRRDDERGQFLGLIAMEPMVRSGLHQHQGVATSFFMDGGLTDYQGPILTGQVGVNLKGATHDAIAYQRTLFVARLEAPVTYPPQDGPLHGLHAGARHATLVNPDPRVPPDINVSVDLLPAQHTGCDGVDRRTVFDYTPTADDHRMVHLTIRPQSRIPRLAVSGHTELWVRGGLLEVDGQVAHAGCFVILEPGAEVSLASPFGALLLAWAEGPAHWVDAPASADGAPPARVDLFGYR